MKRMIDVTVSAVALAVLWPVMLLVAVAVRVTMGGPVLFKQWRPGLHGQLFLLYKFRTMRTGDGPDAERLTRFGRWLRSTSLDELPELWNVLKGEMSLVGPRPLLPEYLDLYDQRQIRRHDVKPGLTGLAQVSGRNELPWEDRFLLDLDYVERQSLLLDLQILRRTASTVTARSGIGDQQHVSVVPFGAPA